MATTLQELICDYVQRSPMDEQTIATQSNVDGATLSRLLNNEKRQPSFTTVARIAKTLGIPPDEIMEVDVGL